MSGSGSEAAKKKAEKKPKTNEEIVNGFHKLRLEQRVLTQKISEMEMEQQEHKLVIGTLQKMENGRKCFRMVGGVLCERTVGEVLPVITMQEDRLRQVVENLNRQLVAKGLEINGYKEQHNVRVRGVDEMSEPQEPESKPSSSGGVLVS